MRKVEVEGKKVRKLEDEKVRQKAEGGRGEGDVVSLLFYFVVIYFVRFCFFLCVFCNQFDLTGP